MGRKSHYDTLDDLIDDLDNESILEEDEMLDDEDLTILQGPKQTPPPKQKPKPRKATSKKSKK